MEYLQRRYTCTPSTPDTRIRYAQAYFPSKIDFSTTKWMLHQEIRKRNRRESWQFRGIPRCFFFLFLMCYTVSESNFHLCTYIFVRYRFAFEAYREFYFIYPTSFSIPKNKKEKASDFSPISFFFFFFFGLGVSLRRQYINNQQKKNLFQIFKV